MQGIRGFVAAFKPDDGALIWRHWTVPARVSRVLKPGKAATRTGGGSTWLTGSYDPSSDTLYWATGNPWPDSDDRARPGDNLLYQLRSCSQPQDRRTEMALPVHAS